MASYMLCTPITTSIARVFKDNCRNNKRKLETMINTTVKKWPGTKLQSRLTWGTGPNSPVLTSSERYLQFTTGYKLTMKPLFIKSNVFSALYALYAYLTRVLIGSLDCLHPLWLVLVVTNLRHSIKNHSKTCVITESRGQFKKTLTSVAVVFRP